MDVSGSCLGTWKCLDPYSGKDETTVVKCVEQKLIRTIILLFSRIETVFVILLWWSSDDSSTVVTVSPFIDIEAEKYPTRADGQLHHLNVSLT